MAGMKIWMIFHMWILSFTGLNEIADANDIGRKVFITGPAPHLSITPEEDGDLGWILEWNRNYSSSRPTLGMDEAWFAVRSKTSTSFHLMYESQQCVGCPLTSKGVVEENGVLVEKISSKFGSRVAISLFESPNKTECRSDIWLREHGDYWLVVGEDGGRISCRQYLVNDPPNTYLSILYVFITIIGLVLIWIAYTVLQKRGVLHRLRHCRNSDSVDLTSNTANNVEMVNGLTQVSRENTSNQTASKSESSQSARKRLVSLDTFRGLSLAIMIFVNYGGGGYYFFEHAPWNGLYVADLVFPWFVFMMGTSIAFAFRGMAKREIPKGTICFRVIKRTALLFLIGISLNSSWYPYLNELRIPGVLQRLAVTYFLTAFPQIFFASTTSGHSGKLAVVSDIVQYWPEWIIHITYLTIYIALTYALPVPGCPKGYLGPGGMHDGGEYFNCTGGAAGYIDRLALTSKHIYQWPTSKSMYHGEQAYDPEGLLGSFSSAFTCFLGLQAGKILLHHKSHKGRLIRWSLWAIITAAIGVLLCKGSIDDGWIPLNKNLWSLSFAFVTAATGTACLVIFYTLTDLAQVWSGAPFLYPGMNSLVIYICHQSFGTYFPIRWRVQDVHWQALAMSTWATSCWIFIAFILYRKKIFVAL